MKLLIAIPTCHIYSYPDASIAASAAHHNGKLEGRIQPLLDTWYQTWLKSYQGDVDLRFFVGYPPLTGEPAALPNMTTLCVPDTYGTLAIKVKEIFLWALERDYDFVLKIDDDTFCWIDRLLESFDDKTNYKGFVAESADGPYCCGAAYYVSRKAMLAAAQAPWSSEEWAEDRHVGKVLREAGIKADMDERFRVCNCDLCELKYPIAKCITYHAWPNVARMYEFQWPSLCFRPMGN